MLQLEPMTLEAYQVKASETATYPEVGEASIGAIIYCTLGLAGEAGEVAEKIKKVLRDKGGVIDAPTLVDIIKEMGDVMWYLANLAGELGIGLEDVAVANLNKLADRRVRGVLQGSGDNR